MSTDSRLATESLTTLHWVGIALALLSGVVHLVTGIRSLGDSLSVPFILAGIAFFVAVGLVLVDYRRRLVYIAGIPFIGAQIVIWYFVNFRQLGLGTIDAIDKTAQVLLIVILVVLLRRES